LKTAEARRRKSAPLQMREPGVRIRFLAYMHYGNFFVINLCDTYDSSDGIIGQYDPGMLFNQVAVPPFLRPWFARVYTGDSRVSAEGGPAGTLDA
jgi:hypothetical protein